MLLRCLKSRFDYSCKAQQPEVANQNAYTPFQAPELSQSRAPMHYLLYRHIRPTQFHRQADKT